MSQYSICLLAHTPQGVYTMYRRYCMKHFLALLLISGYVALVPVCFFGGEHSASIVPSAHAAGYDDGMAGVAQMTAECPLGSTSCAANTGGQSGISHHADMYYSFLGFMQTQGLLFAIMILAILPGLLFIVANPLFFRLPVRIFSYIKKRKEILSLYRTTFLKWLSLSINSPAYALVM